MFELSAAARERIADAERTLEKELRAAVSRLSHDTDTSEYFEPFQIYATSRVQAEMQEWLHSPELTLQEFARRLSQSRRVVLRQIFPGVGFKEACLRRRQKVAQYAGMHHLRLANGTDVLYDPATNRSVPFLEQSAMDGPFGLWESVLEHKGPFTILRCHCPETLEFIQALRIAFIRTANYLMGRAKAKLPSTPQRLGQDSPIALSAITSTSNLNQLQGLPARTIQKARKKLLKQRAQKSSLATVANMVNSSEAALIGMCGGIDLASRWRPRIASSRH